MSGAFWYCTLVGLNNARFENAGATRGQRLIFSVVEASHRLMFNISKVIEHGVTFRIHTFFDQNIGVSGAVEGWKKLFDMRLGDPMHSRDDRENEDVQNRLAQIIVDTSTHSDGGGDDGLSRGEFELLFL